MNSNTMIHPWGFLKTLLLSYGMTAVLLVGLSFLMYRMKLGAAEASWGVMVIYLLSCALGGFFTGRRVGSRRLVWGVLSGILYFVGLWIVSLVLNGGVQGSAQEVLTALAACMAGSAVGAVIS